MKRATLLFIILTASSALLAASKLNDNENVTLTVNAVCTATSSAKEPDWSMQDSVTVNMTETVTYRIVYLEKTGFAELEAISHTNHLSAGGGGALNVPVAPRKWSYSINGQTENPLVGLTLDYGRGFVILHPENFVHDGKLKSTDEYYGPAGGIADFGVGDAVNQLGSPGKQDFAVQCKRTFKPWPKDLQVSGSASHHFSMDSADGRTRQSADLSMTYTVSNNLTQEPEAEIIPPSEYPSWVPKAGEDEQKPGNTITVTARVHKKGEPKTPYHKKAHFKFQLVDVSKEKGVCLNWPGDSNSTDGFDLKIEPESNTSLKVGGSGQSAESSEGPDESHVTITSHDWGAYGKLTVTVVFDDGSTVNASVLGNPSIHELTIPKDDNGNHIADVWEKLYPIGSLDAKADDDLYPIGDNSLGDGFSLYEEYRGFRVQRKHLRTNPLGKDLFIRDDDNLYPKARDYFIQSGLIVHLLREEESGLEDGATNPWVINLNRGFATRGQQHLLKMWNQNLPGLYGLADGTGPGVPKTTKAVKIDVAKCMKEGADELKNTIAHELAHGCNVFHHGDIDYKVDVYDHLMPDGVWRKFTTKGFWRVSVQGGQESGVEECIMRYESAFFRETPAGTYRFWNLDGTEKLGELYAPGETPGTIFCETQGGTGVNDNTRPGGSKAGDATKGNCRGQFCVNDNKN
jgi:hypothetical protein